MHVHAFAVGILVLLVGLALVIIGAVAAIVVPIGGLTAAGIGFDLMIGGAIVAFIAWLI
jgi:hypothetical protein